MYRATLKGTRRGSSEQKGKEGLNKRKIQKGEFNPRLNLRYHGYLKRKPELGIP